MKLNNNDDSHNSGLNLLIYNMLLDIGSHPAWVCGLKPPALFGQLRAHHVTPCVGVWIETQKSCHWYRDRSVTPCVGVWIETGAVHHVTRFCPSWSHPAWVCGLKHKADLVK